MKKQIITIATILTLALGTAAGSFAATANNDEVSTTLTNISQINKIEVHGNVELYISDGNADQVKVYNKYYSESALVQSQNGVLRITSYTDKKLVVWVTANDLRAISAYDNAEVKSFGNLSKIDLDVNLYNNSSANLDLNAYKASVKVNNHAKADLRGSVNEYTLIHDQSATVNQSKLIAVHTADKTTNIAAPVKNELATL